MNLMVLRTLSERYEGGLKKLAADINMSEANLHRCINNNKIQAGDLELIAIHLDVDIRVFFDASAIKNDSCHDKASNKDDEIVALSRELVNVIGKIMVYNK
jgi:DNA-binding Xre family transcriptional regulator